MEIHPISGSKIGVLLIHGMTGTPSEMRPLERHLKKMGCRVECPLLAGHGLGHDDLLKTTGDDWLLGLKSALLRLKSESDYVFVAGLSVGAQLAVLLAADIPVDGLILLSMDLGFYAPEMPKKKYLLPFVYKLPAWLRKRIYWTETPPYGLKDKRLQKRITEAILASKKGEKTSYGLFRTYVESLYQADRLKNKVREKACQVTCPAFIIHSKEDTMFSTRNADEIYKLLGSKAKHILFIKNGDHVITVDLCKAEVAREVGHFIARQTSPAYLLKAG